MKYSKEFKLECVKKYKNGERMGHPSGSTYKTFMDKVRNWVRIYTALGEAALEHRTTKRTWQDKMKMIERVIEGESFTEVAVSNGIQGSLLSKWYKIYQRLGADGLKLDHRGRPPKMVKKPKPPNQPKTQKELEQELEELRAENEYLKKLSALVQKRKDRQPKKK